MKKAKEYKQRDQSLEKAQKSSKKNARSTRKLSSHQQTVLSRSEVPSTRIRTKRKSMGVLTIRSPTPIPRSRSQANKGHVRSDPLSPCAPRSRRSLSNLSQSPSVRSRRASGIRRNTSDTLQINKKKRSIHNVYSFDRSHKNELRKQSKSNKRLKVSQVSQCSSKPSSKSQRKRRKDQRSSPPSRKIPPSPQSQSWFGNNMWEF